MQKYHYEFAAYTDNLAWGRVKLAQDTNRSYVQYVAQNAGKGAYIVRKIRVYDYPVTL